MSDRKTESILPDEPFPPITENPKSKDSPHTSISQGRVLATPTGEQSTISRGLFITGEIVGSESLIINGKVEGSVNVPGSRVTIGHNALVTANIKAREIVVLGKVHGDVYATDRVDIRSEGSLTGHVAAARISIEDGAFFKGGIEILKPDAKTSAFGKQALAIAEAIERA
jgi:cytoskeletal protein CcmA (bactofilin family)